MDLRALRRFASDGIERFPPSSLSDAAQWCGDRAETTGDGRYCRLALARLRPPHRHALDATHASMINCRIPLTAYLLRAQRRDARRPRWSCLRTRHDCRPRRGRTPGHRRGPAYLALTSTRKVWMSDPCSRAVQLICSSAALIGRWAHEFPRIPERAVPGGGRVARRGSSTPGSG